VSPQATTWLFWLLAGPNRRSRTTSILSATPKNLPMLDSVAVIRPLDGVG